MIDDRVPAEIQVLKTSLEIVVAAAREQRVVPPFGLRWDFVLDDVGKRFKLG